MRTWMTSRIPKVERVLVLEDDPSLCEVIARVARGWGSRVQQAYSVAEGRAALAERPHLLIADVRLPDGSAIPVVKAAARMRPAPAIVALSGLASAEEAFHLAQAGARTYLAKPISPTKLTRAVAEALASPPELEALAVACVGRRPMREVQVSVRGAMVDQALALESGSHSGAARLLRVSRQAVQQIVHRRRMNGG